VTEDQGRDAGIEVVFNESRRDFVGEMAATAHHALLYRPGIRANTQHFQIVIGFENDHIARAHVDAQRIGDIAEIGGNGDFDAMRRKRVADRVRGIMRNGETGNIEIAYREATARLKSLERRLGFAPYDVGRGAIGEINRNRPPTVFRQGRQTADMIVMLVSNQDRIERGDVFADCG
jgi:hypothetical protein